MGDIRGILAGEFSGERTKEHTDRLTQFYRAPGSSGIHESLRYCREQMESSGIGEVVTEKFPMDGKTKVLGRTVYPAWEPVDVLLGVVEPVEEELVNYKETPTCIEWFSTPTPSGGVTAEVVDVGSGVKAEDYEGKDVKGKIVFASGGGQLEVGVRLYDLAVEKNGAIGVVTDHLLGEIRGIRSRKLCPDFVGLLRQTRKFDKGWSIVISGRKGDRLRELLKRGPVKLRAKVDTKVWAGSQETLVGAIRGAEKPEEKVIIIGHLSATKPAANCASGPALMVETFRALSKLIKDRKLPRPRRTIEFVYVCEGLGSNYYLERRWKEIPNMIAGLCLCGTGEDQGVNKSSLVLSRTPGAVRSFINDVSARYLADAAKGMLLHSGPMRFAVGTYSTKSDNSTLNCAGIPTILLSSEPGQYFHTQFLTADKMDPEVFKVSGLYVLENAYKIANAGLEEAIDMANTVAEASEKRLGELTVQYIGELSKRAGEDIGGALEDWRKRLRYTLERDLDAIDSTRRLVAGDKERAQLDAFIKGLKESLTAKEGEEEKKLDKVAADLAVKASVREKSLPESVMVRPRRVEKAHPPGHFYPEMDLTYERWIEVLARAKVGGQLRGYLHEIFLYADGKNTVADIAEKIELEYGVRLNPETLLPILESLERFGSIKLKS